MFGASIELYVACTPVSVVSMPDDMVLMEDDMASILYDMILMPLSLAL
jgi:hypothetical protein